MKLKVMTSLLFFLVFPAAAFSGPSDPPRQVFSSKDTPPSEDPPSELLTENYSSESLEKFRQQFNDMFGITETLRTQLLQDQQAYTAEENQTYASPYILDFIADQNRVYANDQFIRLTQNPELLLEMYTRVAVYLRTGLDLLTGQHVLSLNLTPYLVPDLSMFTDKEGENGQEKLARLISSGQIFKPDFLHQFREALDLDQGTETETGPSPEEASCIIKKW